MKVPVYLPPLGAVKPAISVTSGEEVVPTAELLTVVVVAFWVWKSVTSGSRML